MNLKQILTLSFSIILLLPNWMQADNARLLMMEEVYTQLKKAIGDKQQTFPMLEIRPGARRVLAYRKKKNTIFVDEKALEICRSFGANEKDAFAFLLAHEMTHFYQKHDWQESGFTTSFLTDRKNFEIHAADEKEADLFGAFITHLAGYQSIKIIPRLFDKIYQAYELPEEISDYPSLAQRKATAVEVCGKVKDLIQVFETANYLMVLGEYTSAAAAYEYILKFVKYKELYNNIGASLFAAAALQSSYEDLTFHYPIELDLNLPLREGVDANQQELLNKAIEYLTIASTLDNQHYATFINLACAYTLNKEHRKALALVSQLKTITSNRKQLAELAILEGISQAQQQNNSAALQFFNQAQQLSNEEGIQQLVKYNTELVEGKTSTPESVLSSRGATIIEGINLTYKNDLPFNTINLSDSYAYEEKALSFYQKRKTTLMHLETSSKTLAILSTTDNGQRTVTNIGIGTTFQKIKNTYPNTSFRVVNHFNGYFLLLPTQRLFFSLNQQNRVTAWGTFGDY